MGPKRLHLELKVPIKSLLHNLKTTEETAGVGKKRNKLSWTTPNYHFDHQLLSFNYMHLSIFC